MALSRWLWLVLLITLQSLRQLIVNGQDSPNNGVVYRIDCGGTQNFTNFLQQTWLADMYYSGGLAANLSVQSDAVQENTIRYFPPATFGKKNCYEIPVPNGRYYIRMFYNYNNYDKKNRPPDFEVSVEGTTVLAWDPTAWTPDVAQNGAFPDLHAFVLDGSATICFYSTPDAPLIGALELVQVDTDSYNSAQTGTDVILVTLSRLTAGSEFGAGVTTDGTEGGRIWYPAVNGNPGDFGPSTPVFTGLPIGNTNLTPNYFPELLYQHAKKGVSASQPMAYLREADQDVDYLIWLHFAEIEPNVLAGQRVFNVSINDVVYSDFSNVDIFQGAGGANMALGKSIILKNLSVPYISIKLIPITGMPLVCGLEIYGIYPSDRMTDPAEASAMHTLKDSLQIPEMMGWNGDPCAPSNWDVWEGVTCNVQGNFYVITQLEVPGGGLDGYIAPDIVSLSNLMTLNLSFNNIEGTIPPGLGGNALQVLDLSFNDLTGNIPSALASSNLKVLLLNDNFLTGLVPTAVYAFGVQGGALNLTTNDGLCGVPGLPSCPFFGSGSSLSAGAKAGIALAVIMVFVLFVSLTYLCIQKRRKHDYSFHITAPKGMGRYMKPGVKTKSTHLEDMNILKNVPSRFGFSNLSPA